MNSFDIFKRPSLMELPIYPTLGNHDGYSDMYNELKYSTYDYQWQFTSDYYTLKTPLKDNPQKYFVNLMLNSCKALCPEGDQFEYDLREGDKYGFQEGFPEVEEHYGWIEQQLRQYSRDESVAWLTVTLHHQPMMSVGMKNYLIPLLRKYGVDAVFCGHNHYAEYVNMDPDYELKYPKAYQGPIVDNCTANEILYSESRELIYRKGEVLHQFTTGNGCLEEPVCPVFEREGLLLYRSIENFGFLKVSATVNHFNATYVQSGDNLPFSVSIVNE